MGKNDADWFGKLEWVDMNMNVIWIFIPGRRLAELELYSLLRKVSWTIDIYSPNWIIS